MIKEQNKITNGEVLATMIKEFTINTPCEGFINITDQVVEILGQSQEESSLCHIFIPHTTAGVTINENADPDVIEDMLAALDCMVPKLTYKHGEGNSRAHVKASMIGSSVSVPILNKSLYLGVWQGIFFCEFDGPRRRKICVNII
ncbi:secondary thiamine-phosphate synthase enzyme YjbQ [Pelosinus sp. sgz500959]|uniref:secondary thiamine-phosphate synthase enzyme YjbQ n=1 Tax=Pelosinus sp. sgz500959 TaxID=3242472 RepID=UPI00367214C2